MMIQHRTFLRRALSRALSSLLVALVTLVGFQVHAQTFDFKETTDVTYKEADGFSSDSTDGTGKILEGSENGGDSLGLLNARIAAAMDRDGTEDRFNESYCYVVSGSAAKALELTGYVENRQNTNGCRKDGLPINPTLRRYADGLKGSAVSATTPITVKSALKNVSGLTRDQSHVDYEEGEKQQLIITAYDSNLRDIGSLTVNITVENFDESPDVIPSKPAPVWYMYKGGSRSILISEYFEDPERDPVYFNSADDVYICDSSEAGDSLRSVTNSPPDNTISTMPSGTPPAFTDITDTNDAIDCSVSNAEDATTDVVGQAGNRVVSTRKVGPLLHVNADRVKYDPDPDNAQTDDILDRPKGTYTAFIYVRVWSNSSTSATEIRASTKWLRATAHVKIGANNRPQFAAVTGYEIEIDEGTGRWTSTEPENAWFAGDLDKSGVNNVNNDELKYSLKGESRKFVGGRWAEVVSTKGGGFVQVIEETAGIVLSHYNVSYEKETSYTVTLQVTDNWLAKDEQLPNVTIKVNVNDINELARRPKTAIEDQKLVQGHSKTFKLDEYFFDEDGDVIEYDAYTNIYRNVASESDGVLTIVGANTTPENQTTKVKVTVTATDRELTADPLEFYVETRYKNEPPKITLVEGGTIAIGASIDEPDSARTVITKVAYTDDDADDKDNLPTAVLMGTTASLFETSVNPYTVKTEAGKEILCIKGSTGCTQRSGQVAIVVGAEDLDHEASDRHTLELRLRDAWEPTKFSKPLEIQVQVVNRNDAPEVVKGMEEIEDQMIVVKGSVTYHAGAHFTDDDGDRLLISARSSDSKIATAMVDKNTLDAVMIGGVSEGEATITLTAKDPKGDEAMLSFKVVVGPNNKPVADDDVFAMRLPADDTINTGASLDIELDGLFTEPDGGDMLTSIGVTTSDEDVLLVVLTNDGDTATIFGRDSGMATLTITATDNGDNSTSVAKEITVNAAPEESIPLDPQTLDRVMPLAVDVSEIFSDSDDGADSLMIVAETLGEGADRATVEVMDGMLTITGVMGIAPGDVEIKLTATDPHGSKATSTFVATIENVDPTVAMSVDGQELDRTMPLDVDVNEVFADADGTVSSIVASVEEDSVISVGEIDIEDGMLTVTALAVGEATVTLSALDNDGGMVTDTFTVTVNNVNPVVANAVMDQSITRIMDGSVDISETFSDPDDDSMLTFSATTADDMIAMVMVHDSMLSIEGLYVGTTTITVTATDVDGGMVSHDFMVEVENVTPTVAMSVDDQSFDRRAPLGIDLSDTFEDADGMIDSISAMVADGSVVEAMVDNGMLTLNALAVGDTTVTLTATDANGAMISDDFMVTVINIVPVVAEAVPDQSTTRLEDLMLDVSTTFDDPDADNTMLTISAMTEDGTVVDVMLEGTSLVVQGLAVGMTNITLTAVDADGGEVSDTFMATIENVDPVVANAVPDQSMDRRAPLMLDLSETFLDADNDATDITVMIGSGVVVSASDVEDMMLTITALAVGETAVTLTATDANGASVMDEFVVTVVNIDPVVASAVPDQTTTRVQDVMIDVSGVFADPDADDSMLSLEVMLSDGSIADASLNGSTLTIRGLDVGSTTLTLTATDADQGMVQSPFMVTIENVAPQVAGSISPITLEVGGQSASQAIAGLFSDDGDPLTYAIQSANGGIASASISGMTAMVGPVSRGSTTFTITATDPHGGVAMVNGSVTVGDGELKAVASKSLAGFARALLASASSSVGSRVMADARSSDLTLDAWAPSNEQNPMTTMSAEDRSEAAWNVANTATTEANANGVASSLSGMDTLRSMIGETFALNLGSSDNPSRWSVWGDVDRQSYEGEGYDGMASSVYLGADVTVAECWMFGVAVSSNSGESDYSWGTATQTMDLSLTTVLPYVSYQPSHRTSLWGVAGFGSGELDTTVVGASNDVSDLSSQLAMVGGSQNLTSVGRFDLALRGDAAMASLETDEGSGAADGLAADVNRVRVGLEGSFRTETGQGGMLEPFGQISLRSDGGDGDTGTGIEVAGGVRMTSDAFTLEVRGRTLAMHSADEYSESGFSLMATLNPSANATGISVSIAPRWGADAQGTGILWQDTLNSSQTYGALTGFGNAGAKASIDTQIGYGMLVAQENYLLTPFVDFAVSDGDRREMLFGASLRQLAQGNANLDINLALGRVEERTGATSGKVGLNATLRF